MNGLGYEKDLGYEKGQTDFNSFTRDDLIKYRDNLKQIQASSSKRTSNEYIQYYDNDVKNQLKLINDKIGKTIQGKKEIEEEKKYEKDVKENKKINDMFKKKGKGIIGRGVKGGNNSI